MRRHRENDVHSAGRSALRSPPEALLFKDKGRTSTRSVGKEVTHPQSQDECQPWCQWPPRLGPSRASSRPVGSIESQPEEVTDAGFPPSQSLLCRPSHSSTQLSGVQGAPLRLAPQRQGREALRHWVGHPSSSTDMWLPAMGHILQQGEEDAGSLKKMK